MIRQHDFNSEWWGAPVGIVDDVAFFCLPAADRADLLAPFEWTEFRHDIATAPPEPLLLDAGFAQLDVQVGYRMSLHREPTVPDSSGLEVLDATDAHFSGDFERLQSFAWERYLRVPGSSPERNDDRFVRWARLHVESAPTTSLELRSPDGQVQGWFLAEIDDIGAHLALGMRHRDATVKGAAIYDAAFSYLCRQGAQVGHATFSVTNLPTMNLYAKLGARFTSTVGCWFSVRAT